MIVDVGSNMRIAKKQVELEPNTLMAYAYIVCILLTYIQKFMNYINMLLIIIAVYQIYNKRRIRKNKLGFLWTVYIIAYPIIDAKVRGESGLLFFDAICYLAAVFTMIGNDFSLDMLKILTRGIKYLARFQAFGIILSIVSYRAYIIVAWRIFGRWPAYICGFAPDRAMTALCICAAYSVVLVEIRINKYLTNKTINRADWIELVVYIYCLVSTGKRYILLSMLTVTMVIMIISSIDNGVEIIQTVIIGISAVLLVAVISLWFYKMFGETNSLGRWGATFTGLSTGEDVTSNRSLWAVFMAEWGQDHKWFGIGWESFRKRIIDVGYFGVPNGHNCFKQIKCETGYVGEAIFISLLIVSWVKAISNMIKTVVNRFNRDYFIPSGIGLSLVTMFILYCASGNAIYDSYAYAYFFLGIVFIDTVSINIYGR